MNGKRIFGPRLAVVALAAASVGGCWLLPVAVTGITLDKSSASVAVGGTLQLSATISPTNAADQKVTWASDAASIVTVSSTGLLTGVAAGIATVSVSTEDGSKTATCTVTVSAAAADAYWNNVVLLLHMDGTGEAFTESKGNLTVTDDNHAAQVSGPAGFSNAAQIDATHNGLWVADGPAWVIGTGAYTVEARVLFNSLPAAGAYMPIISTMEVGTTTNWDFSVYNGGTSCFLSFYYTYDQLGNNVSAEIRSDALSGLTTGTWHSVAYSYDGANLFLFLDGALCGTTALSGVGAAPSTLPLYLGSTNPAGTGTRLLDGLMDEVRITQGVSRYTASYTPAPGPFPDY